MDLALFDPFAPEFLKDPYPVYRALRDRAPCHHVEAKNLWVLSRYEDVVAAARNHGVFSSTGGVGFDWEQRPMMPMYDPPQHTRLRRLVSRHFTPNAIALMQSRIDATVARVLDRAVAQGRFDLIEDVAIPISLGAIGAVLGVPGDRLKDLRCWSQGTVEALAGALSPEATAKVDALRVEFVAYLREMIKERRASPRPEATDVISLIVAANDDDKLTERETVAFCVLLLVAGFETTVNAMANGALALMAHPDECRKLQANPALVASLAEEVVRYDGPVQSFFRNTLSETVIAGTTVPKGVKVMLLFGSANRDERHFPDPDSFRIDRDDGDHVGYGAGIHFCLGAPLARLQLVSLARGLLARARSLELDGTVEHSSNVLFRGVRHLPLRVTPR